MNTIYTSRWGKWQRLCNFHGVDPSTTKEFGIDKGGGNSIDFEYIGDIPEKEV